MRDAARPGGSREGLPVEGRDRVSYVLCLMCYEIERATRRPAPPSTWHDINPCFSCGGVAFACLPSGPSVASRARVVRAHRPTSTLADGRGLLGALMTTVLTTAAAAPPLLTAVHAGERRR